jgi:hypothetical protein
MRWLSIILCIVVAALVPDLPLVIQRFFGQESAATEIASWAMLIISVVFMLAYVALPAGRWLSSAVVAAALIAFFTSALALCGLNHILSPDFYNAFREFPAHILQGAVVLFIILYMLDVGRTGPAHSS